MTATVLGPITTEHLLTAALVLFGGVVSVGLLAFLLANVYFLPGPPSAWSFRGGLAAAILGSGLAGVGLPLAVAALLVASVPLRQSAVLAVVGGGLYLLGLAWLEYSSRPDADW